MTENTLTDRALYAKKNYKEALEAVKGRARIVVVTKTVQPEIVNAVIDEGATIIGENRVQEFLEKYPLYKKDNLEIHFIGHLQKNKVKYIVDKIDMIESVDSVSLAEEINKCAQRTGKVIDILLQMNIENEETKGGFSKTEILDVLKQIANFPFVRIKGLMAIPSVNCPDTVYSDLFNLLVDIRAKKLDNIDMDFLSVGMSDDYLKAISAGANIVRLGSALFGKRI